MDADAVSTDLEGATTPGEEFAWPASPGEFAARWNAQPEPARARWLAAMIRDAEAASRCVQENHDAAQLYLMGRPVPTVPQAIQAAAAALAAVRAEASTAEGVVHAVPPEGEGRMPCCGRTPLEAAQADRMTAYGPAVTCRAETATQGRARSR